MFQFTTFPPYYYLFHNTVTGCFPAGFPHSDICGSQDVCSSPQLFAAVYVLLRLLAPRHSPYALVHLTFRLITYSLMLPTLPVLELIPLIRYTHPAE